MDEWKSDFNRWLLEKYGDSKSTSQTVTTSYVNNVLSYLQHDRFPEEMDRQQRHNFKHKVRVTKKYSWCTVPAVGNIEQETVLTIPSQRGNGMLTVLPLERFFQTLLAIHENSGHARSTTMWKKVNSQYYGVPREAVKQFLEGCIGCQCRAPQVNQPEPQQIVATEVFSRVQVDLIDMSKKESSGYRYILHLMDHFSKFHMVAPLQRKTIEEVNSTLTNMFATIGLPHILQTDNGAEFLGLGQLFRDWPGGSDVRIIHGRPRHPESQGLVERGHQLIQRRLAIAESEWLAANDTPFPWHKRLPFIQYQVNSNHSTVINAAPYKVVFGREPKGPPLFGRDGLVLEDDEPDEHEHSYSTAYDLDESNPEIETEQIPTGPNDESETSNDQSNRLPTELPTPQMERGPADDVTNRASTPTERPTPDVERSQADGVYDRVPTTTEQPVPQTERDPANDQSDRHAGIRQDARESTRKNNERRKIPKKRGKRVDQIDVGSFVTVAIPKADRHNTDNLRLPGIVVEKKGDMKAMYRVRCEFGVLERWCHGNSVQLFNGSLPLTVEGWESCENLPLRTAAARQRGDDSVMTRCKCKKGCSTNQCVCKKNKNFCDSTCHGGQPCVNRPTTIDETDGDDSDDFAQQQTPPPPAEEPAEEDQPFTGPTMQVLQPLIQSLAEASFSERACDDALSVLNGAVGTERLQYVASKLEQLMPGFPETKPSVYSVYQLLRYGDGYMKFMPRHMRASHVLYSVSEDRNMCLYNSMSVALYGHEKRASFLKLGAIMTGIQQRNRMIEEVMQTMETSDDVVTWAAGFASRDVMEVLAGNPAFMVSMVIEKELLASLTDNDSGPVQIMALSYFVRKPIEVHCCQDNGVQVQRYGEGDETINIVRVPLNIYSADGQIRFNHYGPAIRRSSQEEREFSNTCAAKEMNICNFKQEEEGLEWVQCVDCYRRYHALCLFDKTGPHSESVQCGCLKAAPYIPERLSFDVEKTKTVLKEQKHVLRKLLVDILNMEFPSWRRNFYGPSAGNSRSLGQVAGLTLPTEDVVHRLRKFIEHQMPGPVNRSMIDNVLFPELLIRFLGLELNRNKAELELLIRCHINPRRQ